MTYKQIVKTVIEACEDVDPDEHSVAFEMLLYDALKNNEGPISDDIGCTERTEADTPTDN